MIPVPGSACRAKIMLSLRDKFNSAALRIVIVLRFKGQRQPFDLCSIFFSDLSQ